ncbi:hypothetical protein V501_07800 [Pseudogymnoascus sp. VKM F-4519 (FW-2642)]|nr:hypothetical protein V501_07800 [Pseudogymnoascus sp. VKM F-4519 (FW-2642)]
MTPQPHYFQTEHIIEFQGMNTFSRYLPNRTIVPGTSLPVTPYNFFTLGFNSEILPATSPAILPIPFIQNPFANGQIPSDRIMDALGSTWNNGNFVLLRDTLNGMKKRLWAGDAPVSEKKMDDAVDTKPGTAVSYIRRTIAVMHYLNSPIVMGRLQNICNLIRQQLVMIEDVWQTPGPNREVQLSNSWDKFIAYQMQTMVDRADEFASTWLDKLEPVYEARLDSDLDKDWVLRSLRTLDVYRAEMVETGLHVAGYP